MKSLAETRIANFNQPLPQDPAAGVFLFLHKLAKGEPAQQAAAILDGYQNYLLPARNRIFNSSLWSLGINQADADVLRERLGFPKIPVQPLDGKSQPEPLDDYTRLQFFTEAKKLDSPEAVAIAREVLFQFVDSEVPKTSPVENIAIRALVSTGNFPAFLADLKSRMEAAGKSELEIQRALYRVHLYRIVHSKGETLPFAKRIFELDPGDATAAAQVLPAAAADNDRPLVLKAMKALCDKSPFVLARTIGTGGWLGQGTYRDTGPLSLFRGSEAHIVAELLLATPFRRDDSAATGPNRGISDLLPVYLYFAQNNLDDLMPVLRWSGAISPANGKELTEIAAALVRQEKSGEAVNLLAEAWFAPPAAGGENDLQFPPKILPTRWNPSSLNVPELRRQNLLKPLAEAAARYPATPETTKIRVMIALAADPTSATWDSIVKPFLAASPASSRQELGQQLENLIASNIPEAEALNRRLALEKQSTNTGPPTLYTLSSKIRLFAEAGESASIAADWAAMRGLLAAAKPKEQRTYTLVAVAWPMAKIAADPEWREFVQEARKADGFAKFWLRQSPGEIAMESLAPERLQDLAAIVLPKLKPDEQNSSSILALFKWIAKGGSPDPGILQQFRPWIESAAARGNSPQASSLQQFLDLLTGDPSAASPQMDAVFTGDSWQLSWSLAGSSSVHGSHPFARKFPFLDGLFDLEILAGSHSDRLDVVQSIPAATATGRVNVKLPSGCRFVSLLAKQRDGGIVRWANPQEIGEPAASEAIGLPATLERLPSAGPFFLNDAFRIEAPPDSSLELAQIPWTVGAPMPQVSGWKQAGPTKLSLSFRTADGVEIVSRPLRFSAADLDGMPAWMRFSTPADLTPPPATGSIALVVKTTGNDAAGKFLLSGVRQTNAASNFELPPGLTLLGRAPGMSGWLTMDRKASRFATASDQGIGVFDLTSGKFSGWIPIGGPAVGEQVEWLALGGDHVVFVTQTGDARVLSLADRQVREIGQISNFRGDGNSGAVVLSPDGNFLAWSGGMAGLHLIHIGDAGKPAGRLLETGQIHGLEFDSESKTLVARFAQNLITLPLADWEKAAPTITPAPPRDREPRWEPYFSTRNSNATDTQHDIQLYAGGKLTLAQVSASHRSVTLPPGLLALDHDGIPYFIDRYGQVLRIDTEKLKGFEPSQPH